MRKWNNDSTGTTRCILLLCGGILCSMTLWGSAHAQQQAVDMLPEALKGIKAADGVCRKNDPVPSIGDNIPAADSLPADFSCAITTMEASARLTGPETLFVDLRKAGEYATYHIPGALSLSVSDLRTRPYWRDKGIILVGDGKAESELYSLCASLKKNGYKKVQVLRGGMPMWLSLSQPVSGRTPLQGFVAQLSVAELWYESQSAENLVILDTAYTANQAELPFAVVLQEIDEKAVKIVIERRRKELKKVPLLSVVLGVSEAVTDEQINLLQQAIQPVPVLVYRGSAPGLSKEIAQQKAIWLARERGPKQLGCGL